MPPSRQHNVLENDILRFRGLRSSALRLPHLHSTWWDVLPLSVGSANNERWSCAKDWAHSEGHPHTEGDFAGNLVNVGDLHWNSGERGEALLNMVLWVRQTSPGFAKARVKVSACSGTPWNLPARPFSLFFIDFFACLQDDVQRNQAYG